MNAGLHTSHCTPGCSGASATAPVKDRVGPVTFRVFAGTPTKHVATHRYCSPNNGVEWGAWSKMELGTNAHEAAACSTGVPSFLVATSDLDLPVIKTFVRRFWPSNRNTFSI